MLGNSWVVAQLAASQEGLSSMEIVSYSKRLEVIFRKAVDETDFEIIIKLRENTWKRCHLPAIVLSPIWRPIDLRRIAVSSQNLCLTIRPFLCQPDSSSIHSSFSLESPWFGRTVESEGFMIMSGQILINVCRVSHLIRRHAMSSSTHVHARNMTRHRRKLSV
jgi:hypothetical protein